MEDINYLKSLKSIRQRAQLVLDAARQGDLSHFEYDADRMPEVTDFIVGLIDRDFGPDKFDTIPPHGRWQHFNIGGVPRIEQVIEKWKADGLDKMEVTRRLIDLFFVSVLLDAGAGDVWGFAEPHTGVVYGRSEGIAVASLHMFIAGAFAGVKAADNATVDGHGLVTLSDETFKSNFQVTEENTIIGVSARVALLQNVGLSLLKLPRIFGENGRPGNLVDYLLEKQVKPEPLDYQDLWSILQEVLLPAWPQDRTHIRGIPIGDAWPLQVLARRAGFERNDTSTTCIQPFHKLTQWLAYSLTVPFVSILDIEWKNTELGTGLPEYRNGGLFVDMGVLRVKKDALEHGRKSSGGMLPSFGASSDVIVEWRAMIVALLDELHKTVSQRFQARGIKLSMAQMLEAGTWKGGRELAAKLRPDTRSSPILIDGDGTLF